MKAAIWRSWLTNTLLADIHTEETPDPVAFFDAVDGELRTSDALGSYKWGKNDGDYLYFVYLLDDPAESANDITPVYVGESNNISSRIGQHSRKIRDALPTSEWEDDGEWGSFSKYDHMAAVHEQADSPLYVWILDVESLEYGPYGHETYRQELEAKLVGLLHSQTQYERVCANREFVPNRVLYNIGNIGNQWVSLDSDEQTEQPARTDFELSERSKTECWEDWVTEYVLSDIQDETESDPLPLFDVDGLTVQTTLNGGLKRSQEIDARIRREGNHCVGRDGVRENASDGLLYMMYQLSESSGEAGPEDVIPRYIGKAEAYGKKRELSSNFVEIANDRTATRSFARWGDGNYWHIGELSLALRGEDDRKTHWANALFEPGTHTLKEQTYLWVRAWNSDEDTGPYGVSATLPEVEPLLIGLAYNAYPDQLLNKGGTPDDAPVKAATHTFNPVE